MKECRNCGYSSEYKYKNEYYCLKCLLIELKIKSYTVTHYHTDDDYLADETDIDMILKQNYEVE